MGGDAYMKIRVIGYVAYRHQMSKDKEGIVYFKDADCFETDRVPSNAEMKAFAKTHHYDRKKITLALFAFRLKGRRLYDPVYVYLTPSDHSIGHAEGQASAAE